MKPLRLKAVGVSLGIGLTSLVILGLSGCGSGARESGPLTVVVSILPFQSFVQAMSGEGVDVVVLVPPSATPHTFEPKPSDIRALADARLFVLGGLGLEEPWAEKMVQSAGNPKLKVVELSEGVEPIGDPLNPHVWLSPRSALTMLKTLKRAFIEVDPAHREEYERNASAYAERLKGLDRRYREQLGRLPDKRFVATRPTFAYLARDYGLEQAAVIAGTPGQEPSPRRLSTIIDLIREQGVPVLVTLAQVPAEFTEVIVAETGVRRVQLDPMGVEGQDYLKLMESNLERLVEGFSDHGQEQGGTDEG